MSDSSLLSSLRSSFTAQPMSQNQWTTVTSTSPNLSIPPVEPPVADVVGVAIPPQMVASTKPIKRLLIPRGLQQKIDERKAAAAITTDEKLAILGSVLDEVEAEQPGIAVEADAPSLSPTDMGGMAQVVPQVTLQSTDTLNPAQTPVGTTLKESQSLSAVEMAAAETGIALQAVESEKSPELSPEVESFLKKVEENHEQAPQEIVLAGDTAQAPSTTHHPSQPVIVLPITPGVDKEGSHANVHWSMRWLVEWSHKVIKMFTGKVIYREA